MQIASLQYINLSDHLRGNADKCYACWIDYENLNSKSNATTTTGELDACVDGIKLIAAINRVF